MANFFRRRQASTDLERTSTALSFQDWANLFTYNGVNYNLQFTQTLTGDVERVRGDYSSLARQAFKSSGIVFACMLTRQLHFMQARFIFQQMKNGRPATLFGTPELGLLENPWPNGTTEDLLARMIQDVDLAGNSYIVRLSNGRLARLRPDWVGIILGSADNREDFYPGDPDTEVIGYLYWPGGEYSGRDPIKYQPQQVAHWAPIPDPEASYRGMSWLSALVREVMADQSMTQHRQKFFEQGATVNAVVQVPEPDVRKFNEWVKVIRGGHEGVQNAYKLMFLGGGAELKPIGADMQQIDFAVVQGAGEVRIATAARIPATILGISEGLKGSTLNSGNYASARRNFADGLLRPLWSSAAAALAPLIRVPGGARLWYDDRDIQFLKEDLKDSAEVRQADAATVKSLIDAGYEPDAIINAVISDDFSLLQGNHTGLFSVQLQPPGLNSAGTSGGAAVPPTPPAK